MKKIFGKSKVLREERNRSIHSSQQQRRMSEGEDDLTLFNPYEVGTLKRGRGQSSSNSLEQEGSR